MIKRYKKLADKIANLDFELSVYDTIITELQKKNFSTWTKKTIIKSY